MNGLYIKLIIFYLLIVFGFFIGKIFHSYHNYIRKFLSLLLLYFCTPLIIFFSFFVSNILLNPPTIFLIILSQFVLFSLSQIIVYFGFLKNRVSKENKRIGSLLALVAYPNAILFPLPIVISLFNTEYTSVLVIFSIAAILTRNTIYTYQCIIFGDNKNLDLKERLKEILTFPPFLSLLISLFLFVIAPPLNQTILVNLNDFISGLVSIFGPILIGVLLVNVNFQKIRKFKNDFIIVLFFRVVFSLGLFMILSHFLIFPLETRKNILIIILLVYTSPPAVTNTTYAENFKLDKDFTAFSVFAITILAIFYVPLILLLGFFIF